MVVTVDQPKRFANLTGWLKRFVNVFKLFKEKAFDNKEVMLTEDEYNKFIDNVTTGTNDYLFEKYPEEFRSIPIRSWIVKIKELATTSSI